MIFLVLHLSAVLIASDALHQIKYSLNLMLVLYRCSALLKHQSRGYYGVALINKAGSFYDGWDTKDAFFICSCKEQ